MIKNNKGVTLVELLIVIVVMGIIAAFAIPAVGTIIDNTNKDAVKADAIAVENGAKLYCAQTQCVTDQVLTLTLISPYVSGIDIGVVTGYDGTLSTATLDSASGAWNVVLEGFTTTGGTAWILEWTGGVPSATDGRGPVVIDAD